MAKDKAPSWVLKDAKAPPPEPTIMNTLGDYAGVATRAISPYVTAATLGAPFGPQGAAAGVTALGATDLITGAYNLAAPMFGAQRVPLPSETIQNQFTRMGVGRAPTTPTQQVFSDVVQAGVGGGGQALGARTLAPAMYSTGGRNFMQFLGQNARGQTGASMGGALLPSAAANYGDVTNPFALTGLSLLGSVAGGKAATPKTAVPSVEDVNARAKSTYKQMENANVRVAQPALSTLGSNIKNNLTRVLQYDPGTQPQVRKWVNILDKNFRGPVTFEKLDALHSDLTAEARTVKNDRTRMMMNNIAETLDDFMRNIDDKKITAGNPSVASAALKEARSLWRTKSQLGLLNDAVETAQNRALQQKIPLGEAIRGEYRKILNNKRTFARLTPEAQDAVRMVANGTPTTRGLEVLGALSPTSKSALFGEAMTGGMFFAHSGSPIGAIAVPAALATGGAAAKTAANRMAVSQSQRALSTAAGNPKTPPIYRGPLAAPVTQQLLQAPARGQTAQKRNDKFNAPWWATGQ